jgi:hypothetical protein
MKDRFNNHLSRRLKRIEAALGDTHPEEISPALRASIDKILGRDKKAEEAAQSNIRDNC